MGWNCFTCGTLLKPDEPMSDVAQALWSFRPAGLILPKGKIRVYSCPNCGARFVVVEGEQPRIYLNSAMVCIDDGEEK